MRVKDFDLSETLECGQCFNFEKIDENEYIVVAFGKMLHARQLGDELFLGNASDEDIKNIWIPYFDLERDYGRIKAQIIKADGRLEDIINSCGGIHILNQDFTETLISFIISQNKNITHIKQLIRRLSKEYGGYIGSFNGKDFFSFPSLTALDTITEEGFRALKTGFRAPYLRDAVNRLADGEINEDDLRALPYEQAKEKLKTIKGVGDKVADCVLLFSLGFRNAFPVDVWMKRIIAEMYGADAAYAAQLFGEYGGYAQQYLFMYARSRQAADSKRGELTINH